MTDDLHTAEGTAQPTGPLRKRGGIDVDGIVAGIETLRERCDRLAAENDELRRRVTLQECHAGGLDAKVHVLGRELARYRPEHPLLAPIGVDPSDSGQVHVGLDVVYRMGFEAKADSMGVSGAEPRRQDA